MKIDQDYELFVRDLVLRLTSNPNFNPTNGEVEKACQHAFRVSEIFFARWEVEKARVTEALAKLPETWGGPQNSPKEGVRPRSRRQTCQNRLQRRKGEPRNTNA
jgi:hypothetical protein